MEEETEAQAKNELALRAPIAIRCANASRLLYLLSQNRRLNDRTKREIEYLKVKLARERLRNERIKLCGLFELLLQLAVLFCLFAFSLFLVFGSRWLFPIA